MTKELEEVEGTNIPTLAMKGMYCLAQIFAFSCNFVAAQHSNASPDTNGTTDMDVFMDDIADIMDIDTEQSEAEGSGMTLDLEMEDVLNTADRSTPFDSFVAYFAEVICPEFWMDEE
ncbi:MAG: hypothetical protein NXY57DRAFT_1044264 [Lentinula lateritia]|nr:MAG: hypothetical protein NXY57DRAFT_1044264 [Lentinula lateritia]